MAALVVLRVHGSKTAAAPPKGLHQLLAQGESLGESAAEVARDELKTGLSSALTNNSPQVRKNAVKYLLTHRAIGSEELLPDVQKTLRRIIDGEMTASSPGENEVRSLVLFLRWAPAPGLPFLSASARITFWRLRPATLSARPTASGSSPGRWWSSTTRPPSKEVRCTTWTRNTIGSARQYVCPRRSSIPSCPRQPALRAHARLSILHREDRAGRSNGRSRRQCSRRPAGTPMAANLQVGTNPFHR